MQTTVNEMKNGVSEIDAMFNFGSRCIIPEIKKFTSTIVQGMVKGNSDLIIMLQEQSKEVWALKKQNVRRQGEKASSKLMIPMMLMFVGILIMVIVPVFANMGV
jgi:tight adherence protein C